jgi:deoxyribodipyrimidine photo-lyase
MSNAQSRIILYVLRRDVRLSDNPVFHCAAQQSQRSKLNKLPSQDGRRSRDDSLTSEHGGAPFTHFLPVYIFPPNQIESAGFLSSPCDRSPYPEARSKVAKVWRTGPHRAKWIGQGVWDLKQQLEALNCGTGLEMRVGMVDEVVRDIVDSYSQRDGDDACKPKITGIWMTDDDGTEEKDDEKAVEKIASSNGIPFKLWADEKFYIDEYVVSPFAPQTLANQVANLT